MAVDFKNNLGARIIKKFGHDLVNTQDSSTIRATVEDDVVDVGTLDFNHDVVVVVGFLKPVREDIKGQIYTQADPARNLIIGQDIRDNGYMVYHEANIE